jgi:ribosomal peptide maturation radical SAM protein 1
VSETLAAGGGEVDVCLVSMPYAAVQRPSIALGVLKASLAGTGISCGVIYGNLEFAARIGIDTLALMNFMRTDSLIGEWTFSGVAFPEHQRPVHEILGQARRYQPPNLPRTSVDEKHFAEVIERVRAEAPGFVDELARRIIARKPRIVGCTSTFEQHCPSLALLRRVKELDPTIVTMMGGANCEAEMGWAAIRAFPWVDFVVSGEADEIFAPLCKMAIKRGTKIDPVFLPAGVLSAAHVRAQTYGPGKRAVPRAVVEKLDASPVPDFSDYFDALAASPIGWAIAPGLVVETSRGCWWGQKMQCTFCGLNGEGMTYRSKSGERVLSEIAELVERSGVNNFSVADNILDMRHFKTVLPELASRGAPYRFFYEIKSNLRRDQVRLMAEAGITRIQPGIEGLHDGILDLMAKGNSAVINVQLLRYAREVGISTMWMFLVGFPGEDERWHAEVADWLPLIYHLQPPNSVVHIRFDRFSVYHQRPADFGLSLTPYPNYSVIYPLAPELLQDLAYFFINGNVPLSPDASPGAIALGAAVGNWKASHKFEELRPVFCADDVGDAIEFFDTRPCAPVRRSSISGLEAEVYRMTDAALAPAEIALRLGRGEQEVMETLASLVAKKLVLALGGKYLALAIPGETPTIPDHESLPGGWVQLFDPSFAPSTADAWRRLIIEARAAKAREQAERDTVEALAEATEET